MDFTIAEATIQLKLNKEQKRSSLRISFGPSYCILDMCISDSTNRRAEYSQVFSIKHAQRKIIMKTAILWTPHFDLLSLTKSIPVFQVHFNVPMTAQVIQRPFRTT